MSTSEVHILTRSEIQAEKWDALLEKSGAEPFLYSWYLDLVWPGWNSMVAGDYEAAIPLFWHYSLLGKYAGHPSFVESLSVLQQDPGSDKKALQELWRKQVGSFPHVFSLLQSDESHYDKKFQRWSKAAVKNYPGKVLRRNLRKSEAAGFRAIESIPPEEFVPLLKQHIRAKVSSYKDKHYALLEKLIHAALAKGVGFIEGVRTENGWHCGQFYLKNSKACYLVTCFSDAYSRDNSGLHFLLYSIFEKLGPTVLVHFGGSNVPAIAEFNKNFGAWDEYYLQIEKSFLPGPFKRLLSWL